jgi:hypothetical protein
MLVHLRDGVWVEGAPAESPIMWESSLSLKQLFRRAKTVVTSPSRLLDLKETLAILMLEAEGPQRFAENGRALHESTVLYTWVLFPKRPACATEPHLFPCDIAYTRAPMDLKRLRHINRLLRPEGYHIYARKLGESHQDLSKSLLQNIRMIDGANETNAQRQHEQNGTVNKRLK